MPAPPPPAAPTCSRSAATARAEDFGEPVDVRARAPLGDRDEQPAVVLARPLSACSVDARVDALLGAAAAHGRDVGVEAQRELADDGLLVQPLDAVERRERARARSGCAASSSSPSSTMPAAAEPRQVDDAGERVQRLRGADVRGRLLAADVLLARLKREHEAAPPVDVAGLAGDPARHPPQVLLARGEEPERRPAEVEPVAERLALADAHVDAAFAGRAQDAERDRVDLRDDDRAGRRRAGARAQRGGVLDRAVEVGLREDRGARLGIDRCAPTPRGR